MPEIYMTQKFHGSLQDALTGALAALQAEKLKTEDRNDLPDSDFAVPGKRVMPINDAEHVRKAWQLKDTAKGLSSEERAQARKRILSRAKQFGIDTSDWEKMSAASALDHALTGTTFIANAFQLDAADIEKQHINKLSGTGVLTKLDEPSDAPLGGSGGRRVILPSAVAEAALSTLIGMPLNFAEDYDAHKKDSVIGAIKNAQIIGNEIQIEFDLYAFNFPEQVKFIQANKQDFGFSYEVADIRCIEDKQNGVLIIESCTFTGAAILFKDKAAYKTTSLNANEETQMLEQLQKQIEEMAAANKALTEKVEGLEAAAKRDADKKETSKKSMMSAAKKLRESADEMEAAGVGSDGRRGHVAIARGMADHLEAAADSGTRPRIFFTDDWLGMKASDDNKSESTKADPETEKKIKDLEAANEALKTTVDDLKKHQFIEASAPERKTLPPAITALIESLNAGAAGTTQGKLEIAKVDQALADAKLSVEKRMEIKTSLRQHKLI